MKNKNFELPLFKQLVLLCMEHGSKLYFSSYKISSTCWPCRCACASNVRRCSIKRQDREEEEDQIPHCNVNGGNVNYKNNSS